MRAPVKTILSVLLTAGGLLPAQEPPPTFTLGHAGRPARPGGARPQGQARRRPAGRRGPGLRGRHALRDRVVPARCRRRARTSPRPRRRTSPERTGSARRGRDPVPGQPRRARLRRPAHRHGPARPAGRPRPAREGVPAEHLVRGLQGGPRGIRLLQAVHDRPGTARRGRGVRDDGRRRATRRARGIAAVAAGTPAATTTTPAAAADPPGRPARTRPRRDRRRGEAGLPRRSPDRVQAFDSLYGLLAIARSLEPVRGRKSIVYFAEAREVPDSVAATYDTDDRRGQPRERDDPHRRHPRADARRGPGGRSAFDEVARELQRDGGHRGRRGCDRNPRRPCDRVRRHAAAARSWSD